MPPESVLGTLRRSCLGARWCRYLLWRMALERREQAAAHLANRRLSGAKGFGSRHCGSVEAHMDEG